MARAIYPHELLDQDYQWLISNFLEKNPHYNTIESASLPVVLLENSQGISGPDDSRELTQEEEELLLLPPPPSNKR